jgi:hypothetical protein
VRSLTLILILIALPAWGAEYTARVVKIADGDTITVLRDDNTQKKFRLASISAPERDQPHRTKAKEAPSAEAKKEARAGPLCRERIGTRAAMLEESDRLRSWVFAWRLTPDT